MSGIAGIVHADGRDVPCNALERMAAANSARADDGVAFWREGPAGLVRFRHATTPEALLERQPCPAAGGDVIAFDGRLDNRADLLALLGAQGEHLRNRPDDEIAMALFARVGDGFMRHLAGDWIFAIWQPSARRLFCARSPVGYRYLRYVVQGARFAFASDLPALVVGLGIERRLNETMIAEFLSQRHVTRDETFWDNVRNLPQGAALDYKNGQVREWHWNDAPFEDMTRASEGDHVERFRELFDQALIACTRSPTGVVSQLSGGLDSSSVLSRATALHRAGKIARPVAAITARFPGSVTDETEWSSAVEQHLGIVARVITDDTFDLDAQCAWTARSLHLPVRPNAVSTYQRSLENLDRNGERVLLSGEGGDEFLNGNHVHWADEARRGRIDLIAREAFAMPGMTRLSAIRAMLTNSLGPRLSPARYHAAALRQGWRDNAYPDWLRADWLAHTGLTDRVNASRPALRFESVAVQNRYAVIDLQSRDTLFASTEALASHNGVEYRHPFYDTRLIRFYLGASGAVLFRGGERRHLLREAMRGTLVEKVRTRTGKAAANAIIVDGLETLYARRPIEQQWPVKLGWVDGAKLRHIWETYRAWRDDGATAAVPNLSFGAMWNTAALDIWLEHGFGL